MRIAILLIAAISLIGCSKKTVSFDVSAYVRAERELKEQNYDTVNGDSPFVIQKPEQDTVNENTIK
jgi:outer membrane lipoprotein SlyB